MVKAASRLAALRRLRAGTSVGAGTRMRNALGRYKAGSVMRKLLAPYYNGAALRGGSVMKKLLAPYYNGAALRGGF